MVQVLGVSLAWPVLLKLGAAVLAVIAGSVIAATWVERAVAAWARRRGLTADGTHVIRVRRFVLPDNLQAVIGRILAVANLTLTLYLIAQLSLALLGRLTARNEASQRVGSQVMTMARVTLAFVFGALLLDNLGIHLTALVTTLGIGSLAVALALQDTLGNFFAGLYLQADRPVRIGDYVRVDTGDEGTVMHIGWRSTRLRTITNNTVVLPNERLSKAVVTNYSLPDPEVAVDVRVTVAYDSDLDRVERLLAEAARHARADHPGMLD